MLLANYHTHTCRCRHAKGEDREYVESAISEGMKVLGFSDHCPWIFDNGYVSGTRMLPNQLDDYFYSIEKLKKEYRDDITIYTGFEAEYIPELMEKQNRLFKGYPIDYMIMGEHFTGIEDRSPYTGFETQNEKELEKYVNLCIEGMETGRYTYVAHPDLFNYTGPVEIYRKHFRKLCEYLKSRNVPVEINLLGLAEKRHYPNDNFFDLAKEVGNAAIIGCDAHEPGRLSDKRLIKKCEKYAAFRGLELVSYLPGLGPQA